MEHHIMHKTRPHFLLAICDTQESAKRWINEFNPRIWMDKTMRKDDLAIVLVPYGNKKKCHCPVCMPSVSEGAE